MSKTLSDKDVVKAFECCFLNKPCEECPLHEKKDEEGPCLDGDIYALPRRMVEIYNHQKAEIEEQQSEIAILKDSNINLQKLYQTEREKVAKAKQKCINIGKALKTVKVEAVKECTEKLKSIFGEWIYDYKTDNLLKEVVGEDNA